MTLSKAELVTSGIVNKPIHRSSIGLLGFRLLPRWGIRFVVDGAGAQLRLQRLHIVGMKRPADGQPSTVMGGAVHVDKGSLELVASVFERCEAQSGGALANLGGTVDIRSSMFVANRAMDQGGAIINSGGELLVERTVFVGNQAFHGASIQESGHGNGGAIATVGQQSRSRLTGVGLVSNSAIIGGGIFAEDDSVISTDTWTW
jgi:hypothetical protein